MTVKRLAALVRKLIIAIGTAAMVIGPCAVDNLRADDQSEKAIDAKEHARVLHKLRDIVIEKFELHNADSREALRVLSEECIKSDPEHRGISFAGHFTQDDSNVRFTMHLENTSVKGLLRHLFPYSVGDSVVDVGYHPGEGLTVRTFYLPNGLFFLGPNGPEKMQMRAYDVTPQLSARGAHFPPGASATYQADKRELSVVGQPDLINEVDEILNP